MRLTILVVAIIGILTIIPNHRAFAAKLDDKINLGGFHANMSLEEADRLAGTKGKRECKSWPPNPTTHWCKWSFQDETQHVELGYGADGAIYDIERRVPLPRGMLDEEALKQAAQKLVQYGPPSKNIIYGNLHWGCKGDDCSGPRMIRVWIMSDHVSFFKGRRHIAIGWTNRVRSKQNQKRFERENSNWEAARQKQKEQSSDKTRLNL